MNTRAQLLELQIAQYRHDQVAHHDILCLPTQDRLKHMVLHFSKYTGRLVEQKSEETRLIDTLVDTFIICLAAANALSMNLSQQLGNATEMTRMRSVSGADLLPHFAQVTGEMAKACESLDHFEKFDSRGALERGVRELTDLLLHSGDVLKIDFPKLARARWEQIERKSMFNLDVRNERVRNEVLRLAGKKA